MDKRAALVFDMDGVIIDSAGIHTRAWERYLAEHGISMGDIEQRMLGKHNDDIVREFFRGRMLSPEEAFAHGAGKERLYREMMEPVLEAQIISGLLPFLERHRNCPLAVASNAEPANVDFVLDAAGIRQFFQAVVNGHEVERPKPFPDVYLRAAEKLGVAPSDCVVFEDSLTGIAAARAAGMKVVGVTTTVPEFPDVDLVVRDFRDPELDTWLREFCLRA
jgi:beta-phosphoglucomutase family hydrolase